MALTSSGKVVALHNGDGRLLWSLDFGRDAGVRKLVLWRVPHDVQHDIQVGPAKLVAVLAYGCRLLHTCGVLSWGRSRDPLVR